MRRNRKQSTNLECARHDIVDNLTNYAENEAILQKCANCFELTLSHREQSIQKTGPCCTH